MQRSSWEAQEESHALCRPNFQTTSLFLGCTMFIVIFGDTRRLLRVYHLLTFGGSWRANHGYPAIRTLTLGQRGFLFVRGIHHIDPDQTARRCCLKMRPPATIKLAEVVFDTCWILSQTWKFNPTKCEEHLRFGEDSPEEFPGCLCSSPTFLFD